MDALCLCEPGRKKFFPVPQPAPAASSWGVRVGVDAICCTLAFQPLAAPTHPRAHTHLEAEVRLQDWSCGRAHEGPARPARAPH